MTKCRCISKKFNKLKQRKEIVCISLYPYHPFTLIIFYNNDMLWGDSGTVVEKSFSNQKVASSIHCRSVLEQDTEPLIAPDVQCAISVNVKCVYIVSRTYVSRFG